MKSKTAYEDSKGGLHATKEQCAAEDLIILSEVGGTGDNKICRTNAVKMVENRKAIISVLHAIDAPEAARK